MRKTSLILTAEFTSTELAHVSFDVLKNMSLDARVREEILLSGYRAGVAEELSFTVSEQVNTWTLTGTSPSPDVEKCKNAVADFGPANSDARIRKTIHGK